MPFALADLFRLLAHRVTIAVRRSYDAVEIVIRVASGRR